MAKRAHLTTRARVLVASGVMLVGAIISAVPAHAVTPPVTAHIEAGGDGYLNSTEVGVVTVSGTYDTAEGVNAILVRVVNSSTCSAGASQTSGMLAATLSSGTWTAGPFDASGFSEGAAVCARTLWSKDGGLTFNSEAVASDNTPLKDTTIIPGTAEILDPNTDGYLNAAETTANVPARWTASSADATKAQVWFQDEDGAIPSGCGKFPAATIDRDPSGDIALTSACASSLPEAKKFAFYATWRDAAGNVTATPSKSTDLLKDTIPPLAPIVVIDTDPITATTETNVAVSGTAETDARVDVTLTDGTNSLTRSMTATNGMFRVIFDSSPLLDGTITARATATDAASNSGPVGTDTAFKDSVAPDAPIITITPDEITQPNQQFVEVTVAGEAGAVANLTINDQDPGTASILRTFTLNSAVKVLVDLTPLTDGLITATATLTDGVGNISPVGTATATKRLTTPSVTITSPAQNSLNPGAVRVAGTAETTVPTGTTVTVFEQGTDTALATASVGADHSWSTQITYPSSGVHTIYARIENGRGSAQRTFEVDPIKPSARITTPNGAIFSSAEQVILEGTGLDDWSGVYAIEVNIFDARRIEVNPNTNPPRVVLGQTVVQANATCSPNCPGTAKTVTWRFDASTLSSGVYTAQVVAIDRVGNEAAQPAQINFIKM